ncbi:hypothetical protein [Saccharomonospora sp. CUA-673]|uniref:hypothetical protein n=1 Tax=Saccharomonospora sp. CUA-673 TaxID=1904969 RepID=UPI00111507BF|nr:hypothetical protein [Saccharomonospora sp. CUA-673]
MAQDASEATGDLPGPVRIVSDAGGAGDVGSAANGAGDVTAERWLSGRGWRVRVLTSYPVPSTRPDVEPCVPHPRGPGGLAESAEPAEYMEPAGSAEVRELHSLADVVRFVCAGCLEWCEATLVAVRRRCLVCPGCFAVQVTGRGPVTYHRPRTRWRDSVTAMRRR